MNFTEKVKQELSKQLPNARHCRLAELGGLLLGTAVYDENSHELVISSENELVLKIIEKLINKIFSVDNVDRIIYDRKRSGKEKGRLLLDANETEEVLKAVKLVGTALSVDPVLYTMTCCKRTFLRGVFLASGSLTDPNKDYHFEISLSGKEDALAVQRLIFDLDIEAKLVQRKNNYVVYIKDSEKISGLLNMMGAPISMMELENVRILRSVRNRVNRQVNCDEANIRKTVMASERQLEDIAYIRKRTGFKGVPEELVTVALLRESYPEASLAELVMYSGKIVGKSGMNHRLKKLSELADKLRDEART